MQKLALPVCVFLLVVSAIAETYSMIPAGDEASAGLLEWKHPQFLEVEHRQRGLENSLNVRLAFEL